MNHDIEALLALPFQTQTFDLTRKGEFLGMIKHWAVQMISSFLFNRAIISRGFFISYPILTAIYIVEQLELQTIYVQNKEILQLLGLKSADYNQEQFQIKRRL